MKKIVLLGSGMVGKAIAKDLADNYSVKAVDLQDDLEKEFANSGNIAFHSADLSTKENIIDAIQNCDLVINALPGHLGFFALKTIIGAGKNVVDISFFPEDPFELNELAIQKNVTAIIDCGVAPGMSNVLLGYHYHNMKVTEYKCYVGGLPANPREPFKYKAPFSPIDVLEEYVRPARVVEDGNIIEKEALSEPEGLHFDKTGHLVAFNTDGLRTLLRTIDIPHMVEKTLRYPGHRRIMSIFKQTGFFDKKPIKINGQRLTPLEFTSRILFPHWKLEANEKEYTIMLIKIKGIQDNQECEHIYQLFDQYDEESGLSSMARTTGYTCTAAVNLLLEGHYSKKGIIPPEYLGVNNNNFSFIINYLKERNIIYDHKVNYFG